MIDETIDNYYVTESANQLLIAGRMNAVNREFVYIENSSLGAKLAKFYRQLSPNLAHLGATWAILAPTSAPRGLQMELQKRSRSHVGPS